MLCNSEAGVLSGSDYYFYTPSAMAKKQLFYFTSVGHFFCDLGYKIERNFDYGNFMLFYVITGCLKIQVDGKTYEVRKGEVAFLNCHVPHRYAATKTTEFLWVHFDGSNTADFYADIVERQLGKNAFALEDSEHLEKMLRKIIANCRYKKFVSELEDSLNIYELLITLYRNLPGNKEEASEVDDEIVEAALLFIDSHLSDSLSVEDVAANAGMSPSHFSRKFKKAMSCSPKEYIIRRRLNVAQNLLKTTADPIREIAYSVGFNSESHFINTFTAQVGISPRKFRLFPL